jgi:hypothetical protein
MAHAWRVDVRDFVIKRIAFDQLFRSWRVLGMTDERHLGDAIFYRSLPIRLSDDSQ